jgi:magnesium-transporting ATPase (P-type)
MTNKSIFRLTKDDLQLFFMPRNIRQPDNLGESRISLNILKKCGYSEGLCALLNSDGETGIIGNNADIERRHELYGKHQIALPRIESFYTILARQFEDTNVIFLIWAATIYLLFSMFGRAQSVYIESLTIYTGLLFAAVIAALCDYIKERQFLKLRDEINNQTVFVYRGAYGTVTEIPIRDLVVGDIVDLN